MVFLETERLILRQVKSKDAEVIFDYRNNALCAKYQRDQTKDWEGIQSLVEKHKDDSLSAEANVMVAVALKDTDELVGEIIVMPNDDCFSLGYTFSYKHHRKGYAFEALSVLTEFLHAMRPDWEFISFVEPDNIASRNLLSKLGYQDLGYIEKLTSQAYGKWLGKNPLG